MIASDIYPLEISQQVKHWPNLAMEVSEIRRRRLAQIIDQAFKGVAADLAKAIERDASYVSRILTLKPGHRRNIGENLAREIEERLGLPRMALDDENALDQDHIDAKEGPIQYDNVSNRRPISNHTIVPVISWVQAGQFCEAVDNFSVGDADMWLPCPVPCGPRTYVLRVEGDSMTSPYPTEKSYPEGAFIFIDPDKEYENGSRVIAKLPAPVNKVTFKQLVMDAGRVFLKALNPRYPMIEIQDELHVCGVCIGSFSFE